MGFNLDDYEPVQARIGRFWEDAQSANTVASDAGDKFTWTHFSIQTDIIHTPADHGTWVVKAFVHNGDGTLLSTGYAEEVPGQGNVNKTSALENCETSAIGRALANAGYTPSVSARASREEMQRAEEANARMAELLDACRGFVDKHNENQHEAWSSWKAENHGWQTTLSGLEAAAAELDRIASDPGETKDSSPHGDESHPEEANDDGRTSGQAQQHPDGVPSDRGGASGVVAAETPAPPPVPPPDGWRDRAQAHKRAAESSRS